MGIGGIYSTHVVAEVSQLSAITLVAENAAETAQQSTAITKFQHELLDVPFQKTHLSEAVIAQQDIQRIHEALGQVSGVFHQNHYGGFWDQYFFRGFQANPNMGANPIRNGLSVNRGLSVPKDMVNVAALDFLKGPTAALYGRGEVGGALNISTKQPEWQAQTAVTVRGSTLDEYRLSLDHTAPIDDAVAYRLDPRIAQRQLPTPSQGGQGLNIERLLWLKPDLVIMGSGQPQAIELLRQFGIAVYVMESGTFAQVKQELSDLAVLTGAEARAQHILAETERLTQQVAQATHQQQRQSIYYAWSGGRIFSSSGRKSITNEFIELAGAYNIVNTDTNQPNINPETLIEWNPDNIVLWNTDPALIYTRPELQGLTAVQQHKVFNLTPAFFYNPHTLKIMLTALYLHQQIYPKQAQLSVTALQQQLLTTLYGEPAAQALLAQVD